MSDQPTTTSTHTPVQRFRYPQEQWNLFLENARARGTTGSAVLAQAVDDYNAACADGTNPLPEPAPAS